MPLGDVPKGATVNTTVERPVTPPPRATGSRSGALEGRRFAPCDSISWQHSGAITLRRAARKGPFCIIPLQIGFSCGCFPHWNSSCSFKGIQEAISEDRSHPLDAFALAASAAFVPVHTLSACMAMHAVSPSRFQSLIPCGQNPECPNDAFQLLMSCAQATARRDAERGGESGLP